MAIESDLTDLINKETALSNNKVSRFAYTQEAYDSDTILAGVDDYDAERDNNIPSGTASVMKVNQTIIEKGWRAQASSLTRMLMNHFLARGSYNLNKAHDNFKTFLTSLKGSLGTASGIATLGADGKLNLSQLAPMTEITWASLKSLRDDGELVAGHCYRITDYVTTTAQADTQSAGHAFDVIVRADSASVLNENARAALHAEDTYFANSKLNAWKLKYCLDNDTARFAWADTTNGKGVIYRMIDEFENDLPYDFKNMQFKRYKVTKYLVNEAKWATGVKFLNASLSNSPSLRWGNIVNNTAEKAIDDNSPTWYQDTNTAITLSNSDVGWWKVDDKYDMFILSDGAEKWFYTFSDFTSDSADVTDLSLLNSVYKNKFGWGIKSGNTVSLGKNVFIGNDFNSNTVGNNFNANTVGNNFNANTVDNNFSYNTVGNEFNANTVGNNFNSNTVGKYFHYNTVGNDFSYNTVGNNFNYNTVGNYFHYNTVGNDFNSNTVGNNFNANTVGNNFNANTVDNNFNANTVGNNFNSNTVGNYFHYNTVGNNFNFNAVGNYFNSNTVGNDFNYNTVGNYFNSNTVGNYYKWNHVEDGCQKLNFATNGTSTSYVQKYRVFAGTAPSSTQTVSVTAGNAIPYNVKQKGANAIDVSAT